jgi:hypothetical protein
MNHTSTLPTPATAIDEWIDPDEHSQPLLPILPRSGLFLESFYCGDEPRFIRLFSDTCQRIPLGPRRRLLAHWRKDHPAKDRHALVRKHPRKGVEFELVAPRIQLLLGWGKSLRDDVLIRSAKFYANLDCGTCAANGFVLRFWSPALDKLPEHLARYLIAHELAHAYQYAVGYRRRFGEEQVFNGQTEADADKLASWWKCGDNANEFDKWLRDNGLSSQTKQEFQSVEEQLRYMSENPTSVHRYYQTVVVSDHFIDD